ncbi:MAG: hypothetical protein J6X11_14685 [Treponema sp.]|nr:hypothetical protein [Treponema sp.]
MVSTADREYKETKKIILKKKNLNPRFQKLKDYISKEFLVDVANICVDLCKTYKRKDNRIQIILKTNKDCEKFINHQYKNGVLNFFDTENNKKIYDEIMTNHKDIIKFPDLKTFIVYSSFEQLAVEELYNSIPSKVIKELKKNDFYDFITDYNQINIKFDSKENFDANCEGSFLLYKMNCCVDFL